MRKLACAVALVLGLSITVSQAQLPTPQEIAAFKPPGDAGVRGDGPAPAANKPFSITKLDPALDELIAPDAKLESMGDYFGLVEGPVWVPDQQGGYLLISDMLSNVIYKETADKKISVYVDKAGYSGDDINNAGIQTRRGRAHVLLIGPECTTRDAQGRLIWCASNDGKMMRLELDGTRTVLASGYEGKRFDGPNDIAMTADGAIYMTDVDTGLRYGAKSPLKQLPNQGVYRIKERGPAALQPLSREDEFHPAVMRRKGVKAHAMAAGRLRTSRARRSGLHHSDHQMAATTAPAA